MFGYWKRRARLLEEYADINDAYTRHLEAKLNGRAATIRRLMEGQREWVETIGLLQESNTSYYIEKLDALERAQKAEAERNDAREKLAHAEADLSAIGELLAARYRRAQEREDGEAD